MIEDFLLALLRMLILVVGLTLALLIVYLIGVWWWLFHRRET
jgi:hypothetical protein